MPNPEYLIGLSSKINWIDTFYALIIPWMANVFSIFLLRTQGIDPLVGEVQQQQPFERTAADHAGGQHIAAVQTGCALSPMQPAGPDYPRVRISGWVIWNTRCMMGSE